jgi:hypothetical protein
VRFWEEQDKINQALIPRVMEMHEAVLDLNKRTADFSGQIAASEARVFQWVRSQMEGVKGSSRSQQSAPISAPKEANDVRLVAYTALVLAALAFLISVYQFLA